MKQPFLRWHGWKLTLWGIIRLLGAKWQPWVALTACSSSTRSSVRGRGLLLHTISFWKAALLQKPVLRRTALISPIKICFPLVLTPANTMGRCYFCAIFRQSFQTRLSLNCLIYPLIWISRCTLPMWNRERLLNLCADRLLLWKWKLPANRIRPCKKDVMPILLFLWKLAGATTKQQSSLICWKTKISVCLRLLCWFTPLLTI